MKILIQIVGNSSPVNAQLTCNVDSCLAALQACTSPPAASGKVGVTVRLSPVAADGTLTVALNVAPAHQVTQACRPLMILLCFICL